MLLTEEDLKLDWDSWGSNKPWYCPLCDTLLASDYYYECDGTDPTVSEVYWTKHKKFKRTEPVTFDQFCKIVKAWENKKEEEENV